MDLGHFLNVARRWWLVLLIVPLVIGGLTYWALDQTPSNYKAVVVLVVGPGIENPTADLNTLRASAQYLQTFTQLARTIPVLEQVVAELGVGRTASAVQNQITVSSDINTQVMTIQVTDSNRSRAVAIANGLASVLVRYSGKSTEAQDAIQVRAEIERLKNSAQTIDQGIQELQKGLNEANSALTGPAIIAQQEKIKQLQDAVNNAVEPKILKAIEERKARISQLEAGLRSTTNIQAQQLILSELSREDSLLAAEQSLAKDQQRLALERVNQERSVLADMQSANAQLVNQLTGQLAVQRNRWTDTQGAISDLYTRLRNLSTTQLRIVDPAVTASSQNPTSWLNGLIALVGAFLLTLTIVLVVDYANDKLRRPEDLAQVTTIPLLETIPLSDKNFKSKHAALVVDTNPNSPAVERLRLLCVKLVGSATDSARSFLISSFDNDQDAAELAANLALLLAQSGRRVILCDANLHESPLTRLMKLESQKGMSDALATAATTVPLERVTRAPELRVLAAGTLAQDAFHLFNSPKFYELNQSLKGQADLVIFAGATLQDFSDSFVLAPQMDSVVLCARLDKTHRKSIAAIHDTLKNMGIEPAGIVLLKNDVRAVTRIAELWNWFKRPRKTAHPEEPTNLPADLSESGLEPTPGDGPRSLRGSPNTTA